MRRRFGRRGARRGGTGYGGATGLMLGAAGIGALILFLLRRNQGDVREKVESASETVKSSAEEYVGTSRGEAGSRETVEASAGQEGGAAEEPAEERRRTVRQFANRLEEDSADPAEEQSADREDEGASGDTREELRSIVRESVRRSEESSGDREEGGGSEETAGEETRSTTERDSASGQVTVVGLLAKMGEAFEETGGGQFILSSEDEGNFDLHGKKDELDEIYQQQIQAKVVGRITDEDAQPRIMEVDEVEPA